MLPKKELNIYPKSHENVRALFEFYFADLELDMEGAFEFIMVEKTSLALNQVEFLSRKIKEAYPKIFRPNLKDRIRLDNLFVYAIDALTKDRLMWTGSKPRIRITGEFLDFVRDTETDYNYLEKYN